MMLKPALIAAVFLISAVLPLAAQTPTTAQRATAAKRSRARTTKRRPKPAKPVTPLIKTLPSGLSYMITRLGEGRRPVAGERVVVNYTGLLGNGVKFDSSLDRGQPLVFPLGTGRVIKGWDEGIALLPVGSQATFIIPPDLAYGERGRGPIPPNATLIFIIELVGIEEKPGG